MVLMLLVWVFAAITLAFVLGAAVRMADHHEARDLYLDDVLAAAHGGVAVPADR
ncbi:hypothetical protein [Geodermatophilus sp. Leaf369]|jgi:hypothetical protein|uniref:hypothetical protein n=1 Tax=Geodermatophilus sp. Leaf369 TaxID=1736354 RepID=UPI0012F95251|nr:hypothetical protein [Geodermatophilus sp. Leaf369]